jgi:hypothetical protein
MKASPKSGTSGSLANPTTSSISGRNALTQEQYKHLKVDKPTSSKHSNLEVGGNTRNRPKNVLSAIAIFLNRVIPEDQKMDRRGEGPCSRYAKTISKSIMLYPGTRSTTQPIKTDTVRL